MGHPQSCDISKRGLVCVKDGEKCALRDKVLHLTDGKNVTLTGIKVNEITTLVQGNNTVNNENGSNNVFERGRMEHESSEYLEEMVSGEY